MGFMGSRFVAKRMFVFIYIYDYTNISQQLYRIHFFYLNRWSWDVVKLIFDKFLLPRWPAQVAGLPHLVSQSLWLQGSLVEPKGARVWMESEVHVLHVLWLSKKLQREKQNCAFAHVLSICSMHIESLIDRCYFSILK